MTNRVTTDTQSARRRGFLLFFALLFLIGGLSLWLLTRPKPTAAERIAAAFESARVAARKGDIAGTVAIVSRDFRAGSLDKKQLRLVLFRARQETRDTEWHLEVSPPQVLPGPDNAPDKRFVVTRVVARDASGGVLWSTGDAAITLLMREEPTRVWGIFPSSEWRVVAAPSLLSF